MPTLQDQISVAANTLNDDVLAGKRAKIVPLDSAALVRVYMTGSAIGLRASFFVGGRNPQEESEVSVANRIPLDPDDLVISQLVVEPGDELYMPVRNTTVGALIFFYRVVIELIDPSMVAA